MSTPCSQSLRPNRLVVSEYEVPEVLVSRKWGFFIETLCTMVAADFDCQLCNVEDKVMLVSHCTVHTPSHKV